MRRTGMYFHSEAWASAPASVRAPQATLPKTSKLRSALSPSGLITPFSGSVSL